jgi:hypothetical protein
LPMGVRLPGRRGPLPKYSPQLPPPQQGGPPGGRLADGQGIHLRTVTRGEVQ